MVTVKDYECSFENKWCSGCGNFGILSAMKESLAELEISPDNILLVSGIGQAGKTPHFMKCNMFHSLHGRALTIATGAKLANHKLNIIVNSGDGDCYGEGGNHFINAVRRNIDITLLVHNNQIYGLTKGQASPTSDQGMKTNLQQNGVISEPFNPVSTALALGCGFVARGFSGNTTQLKKLIKEAVNYRGFSIIDILQPCVSFNKINTYSWYKSKVYDLEDENYSPDSLENAFKISRLWNEKIPTGIIYKEEKLSYTEKIKVLNRHALIENNYNPEKLKEVILNIA